MISSHITFALHLTGQCSNFACCGLRLADLHELLEHFEESHVLLFKSADTDEGAAHTCRSWPNVSTNTQFPFPSSPVPPPLIPRALSSSSSSASSPSLSPTSSSLALSSSCPSTPTGTSANSLDFYTPYSDCDVQLQEQSSNREYGYGDPELQESDGNIGMEVGIVVGFGMDTDVDVMADFNSFDTDPSLSSYPPSPRHPQSVSAISSPPTCLPPSSFTVPLHVQPGASPYARSKSNRARSKSALLEVTLSPAEKIEGAHARGRSHSHAQLRLPSPTPAAVSVDIDTNTNNVSASVSRPGHVRVRRTGDGQTHGRPGKRERMFKCPVCP